MGILTGTLSNSFSTGNTKAIRGKRHSSAFVGWNNGGTIQNCHSSGISTEGRPSGLVSYNEGTLAGKNYFVYANGVNTQSPNPCPENVCLIRGPTSDPIEGRINGIKTLLEDDDLQWSASIWGDLLDDRYPCLLGLTPNCLPPEERICHIQSQKSIWSGDVTVSDISSDSNDSKLGIGNNESFNHGGMSYTIDELYWQDSYLTLSFTSSVASVISNWGGPGVGVLLPALPQQRRHRLSVTRTDLPLGGESRLEQWR